MIEEKDLNEFRKDYINTPLNSLTQKQIAESVQEWLIKSGYGKEQVTAAVEYITNGGKGVNFSAFLNTEGNSNFAKKLASMDVAKIYSCYATVSNFAKPIDSFVNDLYNLEEHRQEDGSFDATGQKLLEDILYNFMDISGKSMGYVAGGFIFEILINETKPIIGDAFKIIKGKISSEQIAMFSASQNNVKYLYLLQPLIEGNWENGPTLKQLEDIYNNGVDADILDNYLEWRIKYEFEEELKKNDININEYYNMMDKLIDDRSLLEKILNSFGIKTDNKSEFIGSSNDGSVPLKYNIAIPQNTKNVKKTYVSASNQRHDPLILDLDGDGFNIETKENGTNFDLDKNGLAEKINWTRKDGILCLDLNGNDEKLTSNIAGINIHLLAYNGIRCA